MYYDWPTLLRIFSLVFGLMYFSFGVWKVLLAVSVWRSDPATVAEAVGGGRTSLEGTARSYEETLQSIHSDQECLVRRVSKQGGDFHTPITRTVPFLLECEDGTVLVRTHEADIGVGNDHPLNPISSDEWILLPGDTAYVSGIARVPADVDVEVPGNVAAVVGPPEESEKLLSWLRRLASPQTFYVADGSRSTTAIGNAKRGTGLMTLGAGLPAVVFYGLQVL